MSAFPQKGMDNELHLMHFIPAPYRSVRLAATVSPIETINWRNLAPRGLFITRVLKIEVLQFARKSHPGSNIMGRTLSRRFEKRG